MEEQLTCNICSDILYHTVQLQECEHYFCGYCLKEWLRHNPTCPVCRSAPTSAGRSRLLDNLVEIFLLDHQNLIPSAERRAEHASHTPGEDLLSPALGHSNTYGSQPDIASLQPPRLDSTHTQQLPRTSVSALLDVPGGLPDQSPQERAERFRASPAESSRDTTVPQFPFLDIRDLEEEDVRDTLTQETRRAVTPLATRPAHMDHRSVTPFSSRSPLIPTSTYSGQPLFVNNLNVQNHYYNQASSPILPPQASSSAVIINGAAVDAATLMSLAALGIFPTPGSCYWYDSRSGLWGYQGCPSSGVMQAGLNLGGQLRDDASGKTFTRIYANGRELSLQDLAGLRRVGINPVPEQRLYIDADGTCGPEGSPRPYGNAFMRNGFSRGVKLGAFIGGLLLERLFR